MIALNKRSVRMLLAVAVLAAASGFLVRQFVVRSPVSGVPDSAGATAHRLLALNLTDPDGQTHTLSKWQGKPLLINFWATWCPPCREEMPLLDRTAREFAGSVQFVGVAYDEPAQVARYAQDNPMSYPLLVAGGDVGSLFSLLGNTAQGLPFTLLLGTDGNVRWIKLGPFRGDELPRMLQTAFPRQGGAVP